MSKNELFKINGNLYKAVPEETPDDNSCSGCAFDTDHLGHCSDALNILSTIYEKDRRCTDVIYKKIYIIKGIKKSLEL